MEVSRILVEMMKLKKKNDIENIENRSRRPSRTRSPEEGSSGGGWGRRETEVGDHVAADWCCHKQES